MRSFMAFGALAVGVALGSGPALAQEASDGEIVVTAQKREQRLQDVPISIDVVTGEDLAVANLNNATDLRFIAPSIQFSDSANLRGEGFAIRGVGTNTFADGVEQTVGVAVDGVVLGRSGMGAADLIDIARVEILHGPQGMLFGKNASAGLISITTNLPTPVFEASARVSYATDNEIKLEGVLNAPLNESTALRIAVGRTTRDGYILNVANNELLNDRDEWGVRATLAYDPGAAFNLILRADYTDRDQACCAWTSRAIGAGSPLPFFLGPNVTPGPQNERTNVLGDFFQRAEGYGASAEANWGLGGMTLTSVTALRRWQQSDNNDPDLSPLNVLDINLGSNDLEMWSQELRLTSPSDGPVTWVAGLFYSDQSLANTSVQAGTLGVALPPGVLIGRQVATTVDTTSFAAFGQAEWALSPQLTVLVGGRYTADEVGLSYARTTPTVALVPWPGLGALAFTGGTDADNFSWRLGAQYRFNPDVMAYATAARGYKGPGVNTLLDQLTPEVSAVAPEIPTSFEIGLKSDWLEGRLTLNAAVFKTTFEDFQAEVFDLGTSPITARVTNAGELETSGLEIEARFEPLDGLTLDANMNWLDATYTDFKNIPCYVGQPVLPLGTVRTSPGQCITIAPGVAVTNGDGATLGNAPEFSANFAAAYAWQTGEWAWDARASYAWRGDTNFSAAGDPGLVQDGYGLLGASLSVGPESEAWRLSVFGRNLTDEAFVTRVIPDLLFAAPGSYAQFTTFESRRIVGVSLQMRFGD